MKTKKIIPIYQHKSSKSLDFNKFASKMMHCNVENVSVKCYQIPLNMISRDFNAGRINDTPENHVATLADSLATEGQIYPATGVYEPEINKIALPWGYSR